VGVIYDVTATKASEVALRELNDTLEARVQQAIAEREQAEEQLRQSQKMEAVGQLTGGIAHDFNNLLTGIVGSLDLMQTRINEGRTENLSRYSNLAMASAQRAAALTHRLLAFSRQQPLEAKAVDVNRLVGSMDDLLRRTLGERVRLEVVVSGGLWLTLCDPNQLENALLNLAINARDAMPEGGRLIIETANSFLDDAYAAREIGVRAGQYVCVCVTDTGTGMPPDVIAKAFDPFFTTKPIGQGTGLGLSMIYGFAKQSEGNVKIYSEAGKGTSVKLYLPRYYGEAEEPGTARGETPRAELGETVLVVEDDDTVRTLVVEVLGELGYATREAPDGPSGLRILQSEARIDLLVTDVGLPGLNGRQLADQARLARPDLKVLFMTGYAENAAFGAGHLAPGMQMITKPFPVEGLASKIRSIIEA
jgi:signal transduction histidine kinase